MEKNNNKIKKHLQIFLSDTSKELINKALLY